MSTRNDNASAHGTDLGGTKPFQPAAPNTADTGPAAPAQSHRRYRRVLFNFTVLTGGGEKQVYRAAFEAMKQQCREGVPEDAKLVARVLYGNQMDQRQARDDNQGIWPGLMKACDCAGIQLEWEPQNRVTYDVLVEVSYAPEET